MNSHHGPWPVPPARAAFFIFASLCVLAARPTLAAQAPCAVGLTPTANSPVVIPAASGVALGDIDGGNGLDAAVAVPLGDQVVLLLNDGTGALARSPNPPLGVTGQPLSVTLADFDGANGDDLLVVRLFPRQALIFYNDGAGGFQAGPALSLANQPGPGLAVDLDGKNGLDVVVADINGVAWFLADGNGGFGARRYRSIPAFPNIATGDFDGKNGPDLAVTAQTSAFTGAVHVLLNDGAGNFTAAPGSPYPSYLSPSRIAVAELDGAPGDDIAYLDGNPTFTVEALFNNGAGTFSRSRITSLPGHTFPQDIALEDLDRSGMADVVLAVGNQGVQVLLNGGAGTFQPSGEGVIAVSPQAVQYLATGDLDGQLGPDLVVSTSNSRVHVLHAAVAAVGVPGANLLSVRAAGGSLLPPGLACPTLDLSAGGTFAFDVEGRSSGLSVALVLQPGACATLPSAVLALGSIPAGAGYAIPANCAAGTNRVLNLPIGSSPVAVGGLSLAFDPVRGVHAVQLPFAIPAGAGTAVVAVQAVVLDGTVPGGVVLTNAINVRI